MIFLIAGHQFDNRSRDFFSLNTHGGQVRSSDQSGVRKKRMTCTLLRNRLATLAAATEIEDQRAMHNPSYYQILDFTGFK